MIPIHFFLFETSDLIKEEKVNTDEILVLKKVDRVVIEEEDYRVLEVNYDMNARVIQCWVELVN